MTHVLEKKDLKDFNEKIRNIFNLMTISREFKVIGSAGFKEIKYNADYDLNELFKKSKDSKSILNEIYKMFKNKFKSAKKNKNEFITDMKCGMDSDGEPLRWNYNDIIKGYKTLENGIKKSFEQCILEKTTMKIDVIALIDGIFTEFSDNYLIKIGDECNFFPEDAKQEFILNSIKHSYDEYFYSRSNYMKGLKRAFSYYLMSDQQKYKKEILSLVSLFNSPIGFLYKMKSQLETLGIVLENKNKFKNPLKSDIDYNVKYILSEIKQFKIPIAEKYLNNVLSSSSKEVMITNLYNASDELFNIVNADCLEWTLKNKNVPLY